MTFNFIIITVPEEHILSANIRRLIFFSKTSATAYPGTARSKVARLLGLRV
jgi:hypothetical protein